MKRYVLGLTIGHSSIGWAALRSDEQDGLCGLLDAGVRVFPPGVVGDIDSARDEARNARRQLARQRRVQLRRHVGRLKIVFRLLQSVGLLPQTSGATSRERNAVMRQVDTQAGGIDVPYRFRAWALDKPLGAHQLGRAVYHIAQRRGFLSNRRKPLDPDKYGPVLQGIADLDAAMGLSRSRTLGEHLFKLCLTVPRPRVRARYTARYMYTRELEQILLAQAPHHSVLTTKFCRALTREVFKQLPLKSQRGRVGRCTLERRKYRMPLGLLAAQEFRLLQRVNDLRLVDLVGMTEIELTAEQRRQIVALADSVGDVSFAALRKALGLAKTVRFNMERVDEKTLVGNRTAARVSRCIGVATWAAMQPALREALVRDLVCIEEPDGLIKRLTSTYGLPLAHAQALANTPLENAYLKHSQRAVLRLLPLMREGIAYMAAVKQCYPQAVLQTGSVAQDPLRPPLHHIYPRIPSPMVGRALAELRVLMRAVTARYGRPCSIRLELHRELRIGRKAREDVAFKMRARGRARAVAAAAITKALGVQDPAPWMVDRILLADECGWVCPYTGKAISMRSLVGGTPRFHVAHILPLGRTLDDSIANKTLCHESVLRAQARNKPLTPKIAQRFAAMTGPLAKEKLRRAKMTDAEIEQFYEGELIAGRFVDGCYAAKVAVDYLDRLFPVQGRVTASRGPITRYVRTALGLGRLYDRGDHGRHALDAVCVALSGPRMVQALCRAAISARPDSHNVFGKVEAPFADFFTAVRDKVQSLIPSFRWRSKVSGPLHEETCHSAPSVSSAGKTRHFVRKRLATLSLADVDRIEAPAVRDAVRAALSRHGKDAEPRNVFNVEANLPHLPTGCIVRACKVYRPDSMFAIDRGWVTTEENHHIAVRAVGRVWERDVCSQFEAQRRLRSGQSVVAPVDGLVGALVVGAPIALGDKPLAQLCADDLFVVRSVGLEPRVAYVRIRDSRGLRALRESGDLRRENVEKLRQRGCRRVNVDIFGAVTMFDWRS